MPMFKLKQVFPVHKFKMFPGRFVHIKILYLYIDILTTSIQVSPSVTNSRSVSHEILDPVRNQHVHYCITTVCYPTA